MTSKNIYFFEIITEELPITDLRSIKKTLEKKLIINTQKITKNLITLTLYISIRRITFILRYKSKDTIDLKKIIQNVFENTKFNINMRWNANTNTFIRPLKSYILLHNDLHIKHKLFDINSTDNTIPIKYKKKIYIKPNVRHYKQFLQNKCKILCDIKDRRRILKRNILKYRKKIHAIPIINKLTIENIANSFEYPSFIILNFENFKYQLPNKIIIKIISQYFCIPFIKNQKVHSALLVLDAIKKKHIDKEYTAAIKNKLNDLEKLYTSEKNILKNKGIKNIIKITSEPNLYKKIKNLILLSNKIKKLTFTNSNKLNKCIIILQLESLTRFHNEFPEFHGLLLTKKHISKILNDYNRSLQNKIPQTRIGAILLLINNIDHIIHTFDNQEEPTAKKDPHNFKKKILIIIKTILKHKINLDIPQLIDTALSVIKTKQKKEYLVFKITHFILHRMEYNLPYKNISTIKNKKNILIIKNISHALINIKNYSFQSELLAIIKRIENFCKKQKLVQLKTNYKNLVEIDEKVLLNKLIKNIKIAHILNRSKMYFESFKLILSLEKYLNKFFKNIFILCDNINKKNSRIKLIYLIKYYLNRKVNLTKQFL